MPSALILKMELQMLWISKGFGNCICWYTNKRSMREKWTWKTSQGLRNNSWIRIRSNCTSMLQLVVLQFQLFNIDFDGPRCTIVTPTGRYTLYINDFLNKKLLLRNIIRIFNNQSVDSPTAPITTANCLDKV